MWADDSAINRPPDRRRGSAPRPEPWDNERARSFAFRAITAQPLDYVGAVARDVSLAFHWTPAPHPRRVAGAYRFSEGRSHPPADKPTAIASLRAYDPSVHEWHSVSPYAGFLVSYQDIAQLRGPMLGGVLLLGVLGIRRRTWGATVTWGAAMALLVLPVAVLDFDHRYVLPVTPVACVAAALGVASRGRGRRATNMIAANLAATNLPGGLRAGRSPRR